MIKRSFKFVLLSVIFLAQGSPVSAAALTTGADFLSMTVGARPDGMGQAFSAVADDVNAISFNPAGLADIRLPQIGYGRVSFVSDAHYDFVGAAIPLGGEAGVAGLSYTGLGAAPFNSTSDPLSPMVTAGDTALSLAWAKKFEKFSAGASAKYLSSQAGSSQGSGFAFDAGVQYFVDPKITLAAVVRNLGPDMKFTASEPLPTALVLGGSYLALSLPQHQLTAAVEANFNLSTQVQRYGFGLEYWYDKTLALRAGYLANSSVEGLSFGAGVKWKFMEIDYAFQPYDQLGAAHRLSCVIQWDGPWLSEKSPANSKADSAAPSSNKAMASKPTK